MRKDTNESLSLILAGILGLVLLDLGIESILLNKYRTKHDDFKPIKGISREENLRVYSSRDAEFQKCKGRYFELTEDYKGAVIRMYDRKPFAAYRKFDNNGTHPKFAKQIGVENIAQYDRYIKKYERDSLTPMYRAAYENMVRGR